MGYECGVRPCDCPHVHITLTHEISLADLGLLVMLTMTWPLCSNKRRRCPPINPDPPPKICECVASTS